MQQISLVEMIQVFSLGAAPRTVRVSDRDGRLGWLRISGGDLVHASTYHGLAGFDALTEMMRWPDISAFVASNDGQLEVNIEQSLTTLLIDAFDVSDGREPEEPPYPDEDFDIGVVEHGLVEETAAELSDTAFLMRFTAKLSQLNGFVVAHLVTLETSYVVESFGDATVDVPDWALEVMRRLEREATVDFSMVCLGPFFDFLVPEGSGRLAVFCRLARSHTNLGLALHAVNEFVSGGESR